MSLHTAAKYLQSQGRGKDDQLVHMSSNEVKGLQALAKAHGGSLSINPKTGLAEAGFLDGLLPAIIGVGLNAMVPGLGALGSAALVGGGTAMITGDLGKGLMAGLGAYGGAGLGETLSTAGGEALSGAAQTSAITNPSLEATTAYQQAMSSGASGEAAQKAFMDASNVQQPNYGQKLFEGAKNIFNSPTSALNFAKDNYQDVGMAAAPALLGMMGQKSQTPNEEEDPRYKGSPYRYNLAKNFTGSTPIQPNPYYRPTGLGYAAGGDIMMAAGGSYDDEPRGDDQGFGFAKGGMTIGDGIARDTDDDTAGLNTFEAAKKRMAKINKAANMPKNYAVQMPQVRGLGELAAAQGGSIGGYSDGGRMLKGPGDGMSDSIPATIGRKQPARLADGEFVVPADVVSHLGNGSTDAGAKRLYGMMDKVRQARTGKKKQAPAVKAEKYLPA